MQEYVEGRRTQERAREQECVGTCIIVQEGVKVECALRRSVIPVRRIVQYCAEIPWSA